MGRPLAGGGAGGGGNPRLPLAGPEEASPGPGFWVELRPAEVLPYRAGAAWRPWGIFVCVLGPCGGAGAGAGTGAGSEEPA